MYREKAKEVLHRLNNTNYKQKPNMFIDSYTDELINCVANECKATVILSDGKNPKRHGSSFTFDTIKKIITALVTNSRYIPRETMCNCIYESGGFAGIDTDVEICKGIDGDRARYEAHLIRSYVDERDYFYSREKLEELLRKFAREVVLNDSKADNRSVPKMGRFRTFWERMTHRHFSQEDFIKEYMDILHKCSGMTNEDVLRNSARYKVEQITSSEFIARVLESIRNGTAIEVMDSEKDGFKNVVNQVAAEMFEQMVYIPNLSTTFNEVNQIFKDTETQLTAYSIDFRTMTPQEIENTIKHINSLSLTDDRKEYIGENGYRNTQVGINGNDLKLLDTEHVPEAMRLLSKDIHEFVNSSSELSDDEYLKKSAALMYRFIRIHPFPDSNGRTSRALFNVMTLNRDILVPFDKSQKDVFIQLSNDVHSKLSDDYLTLIHTDTEKAAEIENNAISPIFEFAKQHAIIPTREGHKGKDVQTRAAKIEGEIEYTK